MVDSPLNEYILIEMDTPTLRDRQRAKTRRRILLAACAVFGRDGLSAARTQDIALEAGVAHGSVFAHFGSRETLMQAVVEEIAVDAANQVRHELRVAATTEAVLHAHLRALADHEAVYANIVAERTTLPPGVQVRLTEVNSGVATYLLAALERETEAGAPPVKVAPHFAFNTWLALVHHYLMSRDLFAPGRSVLKERADELVQNYLAMIR
jgi:AcrR family transcriptional regulator